jgi:soluble lytic murein transglycosylase
VIYDWRLNGKAMPITDRLAGRIVDTRKSFVCPMPQVATEDLPAAPAPTPASTRKPQR